jgi:hypothetical protein
MKTYNIRHEVGIKASPKAVYQVQIPVPVVRGNVQRFKSPADFLAVPKPSEISHRTSGNQHRHGGRNRQTNPIYIFRHVDVPYQ